MKKSLILLSVAAAALTPAALSFANTQAVPSQAALTTAAVQTAQAQPVPTATAPSCKPVRVAYAGYGEAGRNCGATLESTGLQMQPGKPAAQR